MKINSDSIICKKADILEAPLDESLALMSIDDGKYYGLNPVARAIWELIDQPKTFEAILNRLMETFEVDQAVCREESEVFLSDLASLEIIEIKKN